MLGSDGSQQEGDDAEAARLAVAQNLNIKLLIDDNDVTIAGHPSDYLKGYSLVSTLKGHGLTVFEAPGEDIDQLYASICSATTHKGPAAVIAKRENGTRNQRLGRHNSMPMMSFRSRMLFNIWRNVVTTRPLRKSRRSLLIPLAYLYTGSNDREVCQSCDFSARR